MSQEKKEKLKPLLTASESRELVAATQVSFVGACFAFINTLDPILRFLDTVESLFVHVDDDTSVQALQLHPSLARSSDLFRRSSHLNK